MASYDEELLEAAHGLLARRAGQRGKLPSARIRRSISTSYYALFHFLLEEVGAHVVGTRNDLRRRRRILSRTAVRRVEIVNHQVERRCRAGSRRLRWIP